MLHPLDHILNIRAVLPGQLLAVGGVLLRHLGQRRRVQAPLQQRPHLLLRLKAQLKQQVKGNLSVNSPCHGNLLHFHFLSGLYNNWAQKETLCQRQRALQLL